MTIWVTRNRTKYIHVLLSQVSCGKYYHEYYRNPSSAAQLQNLRFTTTTFTSLYSQRKGNQTLLTQTVCAT